MWAPPPPAGAETLPRHGGQHTVVVVGGGPLADPGCLLGVSHRTLRFACGGVVRLIDAWIATPDTPLFTLEAYDTAAGTVGVLVAADVPQAARLAHLFTAVVNLDGSDAVDRFASRVGAPVFHGAPGIYWALHHAVARSPATSLPG